VSHFRQVCEHGKVVTQCRCPGPKPDQVIRPCPFGASHDNVVLRAAFVRAWADEARAATLEES